MLLQHLWLLQLFRITVIGDLWGVHLIVKVKAFITVCRHGHAHAPLSYSTASRGSTGALEMSETSRQSDNIRPLDQNWWPVTALSALELDRPNPLQVLGRPLVAFAGSNVNNTANAATWNVLDDRCAHRFAPLSEGRVEEMVLDSVCSRHLTCSYHGWAYDGDGICKTIPQEEHALHNTAEAISSVRSYPTRAAAGMLWVWTGDVESYDKLGRHESLPLNPLVLQYHSQFGDDSIFMRDLPYGMELLGENLLDLSHLPYAHHSLGGLDRSLGGPLPTRMLNLTERTAYSKWESRYSNLPVIHSYQDKLSQQQRIPTVPLYQAEIVNASLHDPLLKTMARRMDPSATQNWTCTISYFSPCHVRYRRTTHTSQSHVELFMCPTVAGKSRVFLYNVFDSMMDLPQSGNTVAIATRATATYRPWKTQLIQNVQKTVFRFILDPKRVTGHMLAHQIFDGDGIFLHYQGQRMQQAGLTFRNYVTPSSADVLLNAYRRYLDRVATATPDPKITQAVVGGSLMTDHVPIARNVLLDRYNTHTKYCSVCRTTLTKTRQLQRRVQAAQTALLGAAGSGTLVSVLVLLYPPVRTFLQWNPRIFRSLSTSIIGIWLSAWAISTRLLPLLERKINRFLFEDYVHAEKI
jgi:phenylpropionate dioxygenase-like ring-hydroxylating dioxygenase large terminal subunit